MINQFVRKEIDTLTPYEAKDVQGMIKLDANENTHVSFLLNQKIGRALMEVKVNQYPDTDAVELRKVLARQLRVNPQQVVVGCGSDQLITMVLQAFIDKGDKILTHSPTFSMYGISNQITGGVTIEVPLGEDFEFDYFDFIKAVKRESPKIIFLTNPNNPTGGVIPREQIIKVLEFSNAVVVVDEAYYEFNRETVVDLVEYYPNLIVLRTLSKAYGLAGARIGYAVASKEMVRIMNKVKPPYNVSSLDQMAALVCLENKGMFEDIIEQIIQERKKLMEELKAIDGIQVYKSAGNFILFKLDSAGKLYQYLVKNNVLLRYFGERGPLADCLRVTIGTGEENRLFMELLQAYFQLGEKSPLKIAK